MTDPAVLIEPQPPLADGGSSGRAGRSGRLIAILLTLVGALLVLLAASRTWAGVHVSDVPGVNELTVSGRRAAPGAIPVALAAGAGAVVLATSGRLVRLLVALGLLIAGAGLAVAEVRVGRDATSALSHALQDSLGLISSRSDPGAFGGSFSSASVHITLWPWVATVGAVLIAAAGLFTLARGWTWPGPTRRYERSTGGADPVGAAAAGSPGAVTSADADSRSGAVRSRDTGPAGTWDALSRGEDPTSGLEDQT